MAHSGLTEKKKKKKSREDSIPHWLTKTKRVWGWVSHQGWVWSDRSTSWQYIVVALSFYEFAYFFRQLRGWASVLLFLRPWSFCNKGRFYSSLLYPLKNFTAAGSINIWLYAHGSLSSQYAGKFLVEISMIGNLFQKCWHVCGIKGWFTDDCLVG